MCQSGDSWHVSMSDVVRECRVCYHTATMMLFLQWLPDDSLIRSVVLCGMFYLFVYSFFIVTAHVLSTLISKLLDICG